eukprot:5992439-Pleurochrysis_carterae.AAC.2
MKATSREAAPRLPFDAQVVLKAAAVHAMIAVRIDAAKVSRGRLKARFCVCVRTLESREGTNTVTRTGGDRRYRNKLAAGAAKATRMTANADTAVRKHAKAEMSEKMRVVAQWCSRRGADEATKTSSESDVHLPSAMRITPCRSEVLP